LGIDRYLRTLPARDDDPDGYARLVIAPLRELLPHPRPKPTPAQRDAAVKKRAESAARTRAIVEKFRAIDDDRIEAIVSVRLLEYQMMNGRALGDLTGAQCRQHADSYGGFLGVLAERLTPRERVRNHFTEVTLQALARQHKVSLP
jgi:hypothetical protein